MKVNLCETNLDGHHGIYLKSLLRIKGTINCFSNQKIEKNKINIFKYIYSRKKLLNSFFKKDNEIYHLLYLDLLYMTIQIFRLNKKRKVVGTLHSVPKNRIKVIFLKNFSKKIDLIIVHSEILKQQLYNEGIKNVEVIYYPSFYDYKEINNKKELKKIKNMGNKIILSAIGGTRWDKGLDILLKAFSYLDEESKNKIILNICGKEETFRREYIENQAKEYKICLHGTYKFLSDKEFMENIRMTDIMVLPYRKFFGGNSGPMTEAIVNKIPCIVPRGLNIGDILEKYNLGVTFECENSLDLAQKIKEMIRLNNSYFKTNFHEKLTEKSFLERHIEIYKKLS